MQLFTIDRRMKKLAILDGSWYVFRAYYWLPELHDSDGHNVNAIYGFFRMMFRLWQTKPDEFIIAWDSPKKTKRKEQFSEYKANRIKMPDEFKWQMRMIHQIVEELWIPSITAPWYEADDIIATIVEKTIKPDSFERWISIVSSDKDLKQLLRDWVVVYDAMKNIETKTAHFIQEYDFEPLLLNDYLSLVWDASDNIPWVQWIGKKSAQKLVAQYGDLDSIYLHIDQISWAIQQKLIYWKDKAYMSKELVTLMHVPDIIIDPYQWTCSYDFETMGNVLVGNYWFDSLQKILDELKKQWQWGEQLSLFW